MRRIGESRGIYRVSDLARSKDIRNANHTEPFSDGSDDRHRYERTPEDSLEKAEKTLTSCLSQSIIRL